MRQLGMWLWVSDSCGCRTSNFKLCQPGLQLACCSDFLKSGSNQQQGHTVNMQGLENAHNLCSGALAPVLEGQEVFGLQMDLGRLQLTS